MNLIKKRFLITTLIFILTLLCFSCKEKKVEQIIDIVQAKKFLEDGAVFIDNRPERKFVKGHINNAVNLPFFMKGHPTNKMTKENLLKAINGKKVVVFYCSGHKRAFHAINQAKEWGIRAEMYWYKNGFEEWRNETVTNCHGLEILAKVRAIR